MSAPLSPIPDAEMVIDTNRIINRRWYLWLFEVWQRVKTNVTQVGSVFVRSAQTASIVTATVYTVTQTGLYRVSYRMRVTVPASVNSSLTMTLGWREGSVTQSQAGAALTGNTTTTQQNDSVFVRADSGTTITAGVVYASTGTPMEYAVDVAVEQVV